MNVHSRFFLIAGLLVSAVLSHGQNIRREYWLNLQDGGLSGLTSDPDYPLHPDGVTFPGVFEGPVGFGDQYGTRFRGYVEAPLDGEYTFWISSDDQSELYLSEDALSSTKSVIAYVAGWTSSRQWDKEPNQRSVPVLLEAGKKYYIEAIHREGGGGDNLAVGWQLPDGTLERPIPGVRLSPWVLSTDPPEILNQPVNLAVSEGDRAEFSVLVDGGDPISFQWRREGVDLPLDVHPTLVLDPVRLEDDGVFFDCFVANPWGDVTSRRVTLTVLPEGIAPTIVAMNPAQGSVVRTFTQLEVFFSEPVTDVDATDLLINGHSALGVNGVGAGPYVFVFQEPAVGHVQLVWATEHGIVDGSLAVNAFAGGSWPLTLHPEAEIPDLVINEFLASNLSGLADEDGQFGDWIEVKNRTDSPQSLAGWSLTDDPEQPGRWPFPDVTVSAGGHLVVFASGKDRRVAESELHTNFKLSRTGEYLGLFNNERPRSVVDAITVFPEQRGDASYGRDPLDVWRYYQQPTPGSDNGDSTIEGFTKGPVFSARRGLYDRPFYLHLSAEPGAQIRYTTDYREPVPGIGALYTGPIEIRNTTIIRATAFAPNQVPSVTVTHSFFLSPTDAMTSLPLLSLVTNPSNLYGDTGIMEVDPRNSVFRGIAWERPVHAEWIRSEDNGGFALDAGLRVQGGDYIRGRYDYNAGGRDGKYSFRLYFRGDYGRKRLIYPLFENVPFDTFERISLRAGMNDWSDPFIVDELVRRLFSDTGNVSSHGALVNLYLNGVYEGHYNPTERIDQEFLQSWHGHTNDWDVIAQRNEIREGDAAKWNELRNFIHGYDMADPANYATAGSMMDLDNFIDYLLVNIYAGTGDWPHNNWRAARERVPGARFIFLIWDAEWTFGNNGRGVAINNISNELSGSSDIARMFQSLMDNPEFRMRFTDRVHLHMFNGGALTDENISARYWALRNEMAGVLPGMKTYIHDTFLPGRRQTVFDQMAAYELFASDHAPVFSQHGGHIPDGFQLAMSAEQGTVYYTMDGTDPRMPADGASEEWTLLGADATKAVLIPSVGNGGNRLGETWKGGAEPYDDSGWSQTLSGIGYDRGGSYHQYFDLDVEVEMFGVNGTAYLRIPFDTGGVNPSDLNRLTINMQYDDGFAAYLNGSLVATRNAPESLSWNSVATSGHSDSAAISLTSVDISEHLDALNAGPNILAIHGLNVSTNSSDFLINATITGRNLVPGDVSPGAQVYRDAIPLNRPVTIRARSLDDGAWSAMTAATFTPNQLGIPLRITEIMYNPPGGGAYEFIELHNPGSASVNVSSYSFEGISFLFSVGAVIAGGETVVLASDQDPAEFGGRYPGLNVRGYFGGSLRDRGERIALLDGEGNVVTAVSYNDRNGWPEGPDGTGGSLVLDNFLDDPDSPSAWRASHGSAGNPGELDVPAPVPMVRINEVMANNTRAVSHDNAFPDWIEIHSKRGEAVDLGGWSLTDDGDERAFVFPGDTSLPAGGYLVVWCGSEATSGLHAGFGLESDGESVSLFDDQTNLVDIVSFGAQIADYSIGRTASMRGEWALNDPTPGAANVETMLAASNALVINEWLADAPPGLDDWFELHNRNSVNPASLRGIYLGNGKSLHGVRGHSFIAPGGYLQIRADEQAGPDHVGFKLSALGGEIVLYDRDGELVQSVTYGPQIEELTEGRYPDASASIRTFPGSASPGAGNYVLNWTGPRIEEVMALNRGGVSMSDGRVADWLELHNPNDTPFDLTGMGLSIGKETPVDWTFPAGTMMPPSGYLVIWCDGDLPASTTAETELNTGHSLSGMGDDIRLFNGLDRPVQTVSFGPQVPDLSLGLGGSIWVLCAEPTPGWANSRSAVLGSVGGARFNEWQSNPSTGDDWVEIHNTGSDPMSMSGMYLTDDPSIAGRTKFRFPANSFIPAGGWLKLVADGDVDKGATHLAFELAAGGEHLRMYSSGLSLLDFVDFGPQAIDTSFGRFPDGEDPIREFVHTVTPGESNYLPIDNVVVNELLAHTDPPLVDAVEFYNPTRAAVDIGGWFLSDDADTLKKYQVPAMTTIPAGGYQIFDENNFDGGDGTIIPFTFNSARGDGVYLSRADELGEPSGFRSQQTFGPSFNGVSFGRHRTSVGDAFVPQSRRSLGGVNAAPAIGPIVVNEIMAAPLNLPGWDAVDAEYVELINISETIVPLYDPAHPANTWKLRGGIDIDLQPGLSLEPEERLLVVAFDPVARPDALVAFRERYIVPTAMQIVGPFAGRLSSAGDSVSIHQPDAPQTSGPDIGLVPYVETEAVIYAGSAPWPNTGIGFGASLQRYDSAAFGNDPANWIVTVPTVGMFNSGNSGDSDNDGIPDFWERNNGLNPSFPADATVDSDGDGVPNIDEYRADTNPHDGHDYLRIESIVRHAAWAHLGFRAEAGVAYTIQYCDEPRWGTWRTLRSVASGFHASDMTISDGEAAGMRLYRVSAP